MWYFYKKIDNEELDNLINQINNLFSKILNDETCIYPDWMRETRLKVDFEKFRQAYKLCLNDEKNRLIKAFELNIKIEEICKMEIIPISYEKLLTNSSDEFHKCIEILQSIQSYLYSNLLKLKGFEETAGTLKTYYERFYNETIEYVCPFCGLDNMLTSKDLYREAFDHYFPKSKYPFVSFLRENLFPICHTCNSTYKGEKDPKDYGRTFYPFAPDLNDCELLFEIKTDEIVDVDIKSEKFINEINTWNELFGIKDRIRNFAEVNLSGWLSNVTEVMHNYNLSFEQARNGEMNSCNPKMQGQKFIKKAILKAYK
ncbi:MAG: hypothetical protein Q8936_15065 [Bacillota bacterium]|nr:hypothetical protein [Bacillota bacterium]